MSKKYRPSNGSEGDHFISTFCMNCIHENPNPELKPNCEILTFTMCYDVNEPEYPEEWIYNDQGKPVCSSFKKWDWGNDGDPNDPDNPKAPIPEDPNQLCIPFMIAEIEESIKQAALNLVLGLTE